MEKLAVVTGTSSGIGRSVARLLLDAGWQVTGMARRDGVLSHPKYHHVNLDLSDSTGVEQYFEGQFLAGHPPALYERVGLVNNAALLEPIVPLHKIGMDELTRAFIVNSVVPMWLTGFFLSHFAAPALRIVNISSGAANNPRAGWGVYCSTKAALQMAGRVFAEEAQSENPPYAGENMALYNFEPGLVDTAMQTLIRATPPRDFPSVERFVGFFEQNQLKNPEQPAAEICAYLESDPKTPHQEGRSGN